MHELIFKLLSRWSNLSYSILCFLLALFILFTSHIWTYPELVPNANIGPLTDHETDVALSEIPRSQSLVTFELFAFHIYTLEAKPTAK